MIKNVTASKFGCTQQSEQAPLPSLARTVTKPEKVALCRECHGTGKVTKLGFIPEQSSPTRSLSRKCPNCDGSGRVLVSCEMKLHIRPYKESK